LVHLPYLYIWCTVTLISNTKTNTNVYVLYCDGTKYVNNYQGQDVCCNTDTFSSLPHGFFLTEHKCIQSVKDYRYCKMFLLMVASLSNQIYGVANTEAMSLNGQQKSSYNIAARTDKGRALSTEWPSISCSLACQRLVWVIKGRTLLPLRVEDDLFSFAVTVCSKYLW